MSVNDGKDEIDGSLSASDDEGCSSDSSESDHNEEIDDKVETQENDNGSIEVNQNEIEDRRNNLDDTSELG